MEIENCYTKRVTHIFQNDFLKFYFLNVDISLNMHNPNLKLSMCIKNIVIEGTVSQNFDISPDWFSIKSRKQYFTKYIQSYPFF